MGWVTIAVYSIDGLLYTKWLLWVKNSAAESDRVESNRNMHHIIWQKILTDIKLTNNSRHKQRQRTAERSSCFGHCLRRSAQLGVVPNKNKYHSHMHVIVSSCSLKSLSQTVFGRQISSQKLPDLFTEVPVMAHEKNQEDHFHRRLRIAISNTIAEAPLLFSCRAVAVPEVKYHRQSWFERFRSNYTKMHQIKSSTDFLGGQEKTERSNCPLEQQRCLFK